jgi:uncharacterized protein (TIGR02444 family)
MSGRKKPASRAGRTGRGARPGAAAAAGELDSELWRFACAFYADTDVASACLALQDRRGVDVCLLLTAIFAAIRLRAPLLRHEIAALDAEARDWRDEIIAVLRRLRTRLKSGPPPAPSAAADRLRAHIKGAELDAEQIAFCVMRRWLDRRTPRQAPAELVAHEVLAAVVSHYAGAHAPPAADLGEALKVLAAAMRRTAEAHGAPPAAPGRAAKGRSTLGRSGGGRPSSRDPGQPAHRPRRA